MPTVPCAATNSGLPSTWAYPSAMATDISSCRQVIHSGLELPPWLIIDSCKPRKLDPGFEKQYLKPMDFRTSTMKSEPGRPDVTTSADRGTCWVSAANCAGVGSGAPPRRGSAGRASADGVPVARAAAPAAAPFRKPRRLTGPFFDFAIDSLLSLTYGRQAPLETQASRFHSSHCRAKSPCVTDSLNAPSASR